MLKVRIKQNKLGDTRTATKIPTFYEFSDSNQLHCRDVKKLMEAIGIDIIERGRNHDITKIEEPHRSLFYRELCAKIEGKIDDFTKGEWYPMHCKTERHHLNEHCPDDVNLIDVIEMICDCVCAGLARSGNVYPIEISSEILQKAIQNTVQMCIDAVEVETEEEMYESGLKERLADDSGSYDSLIPCEDTTDGQVAGKLKNPAESLLSGQGDGAKEQECKLEPCPFCGNEPTISCFKGKDGWRDRYAVICRYDEGGCGAESGLYHYEAEALEAWNRRVGETDVTV